jgi:flagellar biosynthesis protein FlhB
MVLLAGGVGLYTLAPLTGGRLLALIRDGLSLSRADVIDTDSMLRHLAHAAAQGLLGAVPLLALLLAAAVLAPLMIGGWSFSSRVLSPDFSRLDPLAGLARVFSVRGLIELGKALDRKSVV